MIMKHWCKEPKMIREMSQPEKCLLHKGEVLLWSPNTHLQLSRVTHISGPTLSGGRFWREAGNAGSCWPVSLASASVGDPISRDYGGDGAGYILLQSLHVYMATCTCTQAPAHHTHQAEVNKHE